MKLILEFDESNNFEAGADKDTRLKIIRNVVWLINCASGAIDNVYEANAPRRIEMDKLCKNLLDQVRSQITKEEAEILKIADNEH